MRTVEEVRAAAEKAQVLIDVLTKVGGMDGPIGKPGAVENADRWFHEMTSGGILSIESGRLRLSQGTDELTDKPDGYFRLYVNVG